METSLNIALAQTTVSPLPEENLQNVRKWAQNASEHGAELVVFPEMFMALPGDNISLAHISEPVDGPFVTALAECAQENNTAIICGIWETVDDDSQRAANVVVAIGADGTLLARYHKIHLFDALNIRESDRMVRGEKQPPLFCINGLKLGLAICYDLRFPELFRNLATRGAEAVIVPSAWYAGPLKETHWLTLLRARAIENTMYVCGANLCGPPFAARSVIFDPFGATVAGSGESEALVSGRLDQKRIQEVRDKLPTLTHLRKEIFFD